MTNLFSMKRKRNFQNWFDDGSRIKRLKFIGPRFGLNLGFIDEDGNTKLHIAAENANYKEIKTLVNRGANLYFKNKNGMTPLHSFCTRCFEKIDSEKIIKCMKLLLGDSRHVNWKCRSNGYKGQTLLMLLVALDKERELKVAPFKFLIDKGADLSLKDEKGWDVLNWASKNLNKNIDLIKFLLDSGANVNIKDNGDIALLCDLEIIGFVKDDDFDVINKLVKMFIKYGVDVNLRMPFKKFLSNKIDGVLYIFGVPKKQIFTFLKILFVNGADVDLSILGQELRRYLKDGTEEMRKNYDIFRRSKKLLNDGMQIGNIKFIKDSVSSLKKSLKQDCISPYERLIALSNIVVVSKKFNQEFIKESEIFDVYLKRIPFNYDFFYNFTCSKLRSLVFNSFVKAKDKFGRSIELVACNYPEHVIIVFKRRPRDFFTGEVNYIGKKKQITQLLKYLVFGELVDKKEEEYIKDIIKNSLVLKKIKEKLVPNTDFYNYFISAIGVYIALQNQCVLGNLKGIQLDCAHHIFSFLPGENGFAKESYSIIKEFI